MPLGRHAGPAPRGPDPTDRPPWRPVMTPSDTKEWRSEACVQSSGASGCSATRLPWRGPGGQRLGRASEPPAGRHPSRPSRLRRESNGPRRCARLVADAGLRRGRQSEVPILQLPRVIHDVVGGAAHEELDRPGPRRPGHDCAHRREKRGGARGRRVLQLANGTRRARVTGRWHWPGLRRAERIEEGGVRTRSHSPLALRSGMQCRSHRRH
jgi:hypothetical protein